MRISLVILCFLFSIGLGFTQETTRIQPGKLYTSGETIMSPKYGFSNTIPDGWAGYLPQGTEVFGLRKNDGTSGDVLLFARENSDLATLKSAWAEGLEISPSIRITTTDVSQEGDMIYSEVSGEGENLNRANRGFVISRCGGYGPCVTLLMFTPRDYYESTREAMLAFMRAGVFVEPGEADPYADFDWQKFLSNKILVAFELQELSKMQNKVDLCADGSFNAQVKQSGWFNQGDNSYKGRNKGTWSVSSTGPQTVLRLEFDKAKLPPLEVVLRIEEEKIFANDRRYYAGYSQHCN